MEDRMRLLDDDSFMPMMQKYPDIMSDLDESISLDEMSKAEKCFYALEIESLLQLECTNESAVLSLKVLHCNHLKTTRGAS